jgi:hypothetical protein
MNCMTVVFEFQIDREGNLSVREWEWESGIGNVGVALPMMQGESPINTINTTTSERSPTVMQYSYQGMDKDPTAEKPREMIQ